MTPSEYILKLFDLGQTPVQIIASTGAKRDLVYKVLRRLRPGRKRAPRTKTSHVPAQVRRLYIAGIEPTRIATLCRCSTAYVYAILKR